MLKHTANERDTTAATELNWKKECIANTNHVH